MILMTYRGRKCCTVRILCSSIHSIYALVLDRSCPYGNITQMVPALVPLILPSLGFWFPYVYYSKEAIKYVQSLSDL
jgi:hypothetical protein